MPVLKDVLPELDDPRNSLAHAYRLRDVQVKEIKLGSGAPCSTHSELFAPWPGKEENVEKWFVLENGQAVGKHLNPEGKLVFPVVSLKSF